MVVLKPRIDQLVYRLVTGPDSPSLRLADGSSPELRPGEAGFAEAVAGLGAMPLDRYGQEGAPLEIRVPWHGSTMWLVSDESQGESLIQEGVSRSRIWMADELMRLHIVAREARAIRMIGLTKVVLEGEITEVRRTADSHSR